MFLSFDMTVIPCGSGNDAGMVRDYIKTYYGHPAQLHVKGAPLVSTFNGQDCHFGQGSPNDGWASVVKNDMPPVQFVPAFFVGNPTNLRNFGVTNGIFSVRTFIVQVNVVTKYSVYV
jgi:glucan endo-1,3-alpha-glucosidase